MSGGVYLAGGINGLSIEIATNWREYATGIFEAAGIRVWDPLRDKVSGNDGYFQDRLYADQEIVEQDKSDIALSEAMLVEYTIPDRNYTGTSMEVLYGYMSGKFIVVWSEHAKDSPWLRYHSHVILPDLDECCREIIDYIRGLEGQLPVPKQVRSVSP